MNLETVTGYKVLFGSPDYSYNDLLADISSDVINVFMIALNNELNAPEDYDNENQKRIWNIISSNFTQKHLDFLAETFRGYKEENKSFQNLSFGRRYLLALLLREFKRNNHLPNFVDTTPEQEFRILLAYLMVVDELNDADEVLIKELNKGGDENGKYKMIWLSFIDQYEFNDDNNAFFEMIKLLCFCKYSYEHLKPYLREYLATFNFKSLSPFLASCTQLVKSTLTHQPDKLFRKLNLIMPRAGVDTKHLDQQTINHLLGSSNISLTDIRMFPLYKNSRNEFMVIDENTYRKKLYRGPFFEIYKQTSLKKTKSFNDHSNDISKGTMEELCFRSMYTPEHGNPRFRFMVVLRHFW